MPARIAKQIYQKLLAAKGVLIIPHQNPDGDALGSATALMHILRRLNIEHAVFCATEASKKYDFLPRVDALSTNTALWEGEHFDTVLVVDSGDLRYAGIDEHIKKMMNRPFIINIDHHITNEHFGDLNLVIPTASSTTEVLYTFCKVNDIEIDTYLATCLLTGLITDTGNFTNAATTIKSLQGASDLIQKGAKLELIQSLTLKDTSIDALKLWGTVLSRLQKHDTHEIVYTYLTQQDLKEHNIDESETEGIANFLHVLKEGKAALILKELPDNKVKGSLRTTRDDVDVSVIAQKLGGGGHKKAAGFTVDGTIGQALEQVWTAMGGTETKKEDKKEEEDEDDEGEVF